MAVIIIIIGVRPGYSGADTFLDGIYPKSQNNPFRRINNTKYVGMIDITV